MEIIYIMLAVSVLLASGFLGAFLWSVRSGQYDDNYTPSVRILFDEQEQTQAADGKDKDEKANDKKE